MIKQKGFTLIELIVVIVILGILAATAAPKFIDLKADAEKAAAQAAAGAISSATAMNYGKFAVKGTTGTNADDAKAVSTCIDTTIADLLQDQSILGTNGTYTLESVAGSTCAKEGDTIDCTLKKGGKDFGSSGNDVVAAKVVCTGPATP